MSGNTFKTKVFPDTAIDLNTKELNKNDDEERRQPSPKPLKLSNDQSSTGINLIKVMFK